MSSIRRLRRLAGLTESVADDPHTNRKIESQLSAYEPEQRIVVLDMLETLKDSPDGLSSQDWAERVRAVHGDPNMPLTDLFRRMIKDFAWLVRRGVTGKWEWTPSSAGTAMTDTEMEADPLKPAISMQITLVSTAMQIMRGMESFSADDVARGLLDQVPMMRGLGAKEMAHTVAEHIITHFQSMLIPLGNGRYRMKPEEQPSREGTLDFLRGLAQQAADKRANDGMDYQIKRDRAQRRGNPPPSPPESV